MVLGCLSTALFFLEPNPFEGTKTDFILILVSAVWLIYTADHIMDGYKTKGQSGIFRYDYHYIYRWALVPICIALSAIIIWLLFKNQTALFITNGLWLIPLLVVYYFLKINGKLKPLAKMLIVSIIVSAVIVSFYNSSNIFRDFFSFENLIMALLVFLNQLVLEHFEYHEEHKELQPDSSDLYISLAKRVFIWLTIVLSIALILSILLLPNAWPFVASLFLIGLFLRMILQYPNRFSQNRRYRFWADFIFVFMWPLLKFFQSIYSLF